MSACATQGGHNYRFDDEERVFVIRSHEVGQATINRYVKADRSLERRKRLHTKTHDRHHDAEN